MIPRWSRGHPCSKQQCSLASKVNLGEFSGTAVVRTGNFMAQGLDSVPDWVTKVLQATQLGKKQKKLCAFFKIFNLKVNVTSGI